MLSDDSILRDTLCWKGSRIINLVRRPRSELTSKRSSPVSLERTANSRIRLPAPAVPLIVSAPHIVM